jgi:non-canonical poly(A) RNA polymerase PAPD5/7
MKALTSSSSSREARRQDHRDMPKKEGLNKDGRRRRRNKQEYLLPPGHDDVYVHTPWLALIPERQYASAEQRWANNSSTDCHFVFSSFVAVNVYRLHDEIAAYTTYMQPTAQEHNARQTVLTCVQGIVHRFLDGQVNLFGSCATGLWLPTRYVVRFLSAYKYPLHAISHVEHPSDIDIAISTRLVGDQSKKSVLFQLSSRIKSSGLTPYVLVNHHARVPILKFTTRPEYGKLPSSFFSHIFCSHVAV